MSTSVITRCDECGKQKGEVNHWFQMWLIAGQKGKLFVQVYAREVNGACHDVCGAECATKAFQRFLATGKLEAENNT